MQHGQVLVRPPQANGQGPGQTLQHVETQALVTLGQEVEVAA